MAGLKLTVLFLFVNVICFAVARVIGRKSLAERTSEILIRIPEGIPDRPWFPIDPPHFTIKPPKPTYPPVSQRSELDLAFIMDTTGSMSSYISNVRQHIKDLVDAIAASSSTNLRIALIEYRDHPPQDRFFVTRTHHFTSSVSTMKSWLNAARAQGGGDGPEAVADAMFQATTLSWRPNAAKISVLVTDAPPHGLVSSGDSFPSGCPSNHDPIDIARTLARRGITLYTVGCEPSVVPYTDFFMALAYLTGGQYIPLSVPRVLTDAIIAGAKEELSLKKFSADVKTEVKKAVSAGRVVNERQIAQSVFAKLKSEGATAKQLLKNNKPLEGATAQAKAIAGATTLADAKKIFTPRPRSGGSPGGRPISSGIRPTIGGGSRISSGIRSSVGEKMDIPAARMATAVGSSGSSTSGAGESFAAVEKAVSLDQISRLVKLEAAKMSV
ncbi:uncharacterized protein LOC123558204 [Mercenaria mercenaria]|uniref:uncharacterized protein LOC123558204 n=1 Tax=Mercenaria mercenaria TaxID=6596 RepID=UPI00234E4578|nr:uncharacterized protein LOC123558204 [Mercenaria mercenaria]